MKRVLVIGATGDQGHPLLTRLIAAGMQPVAALRNAAGRAAFVGTQFAAIETVEADLYDLSSMVRAAKGMDALVVHLPFVFDRQKAQTMGDTLAKAAHENDLDKIIFNTSCFVAEHDNGNPAHDGRRAIEKAIIDSGIRYAIFEPKVFMDNMIRSWCKPLIVNEGVFAYPAAPTLRISWICLDDVAAFMVEALANDALPDGRYAIGGPQALVGDEVAERLSQAAGKPIRFKSLSPEQFASDMSLLVTGSAKVEPLSIYDGMASFYRWYNEQEQSPLIADTDAMARYFSFRPTELEAWATRQDWSDPLDPALAIRMASTARASAPVVSRPAEKNAPAGAN